VSQLPAILHEPIEALLEDGDRHFDQGRLAEALECYEAARARLPSDLTRWEASTWVLTAIGDTAFLMGDYPRAHAALTLAQQCPQGAENPFVLLRLGQTEFELGRTDAARTRLAEAFRLGGDEVFEDEAPKYMGLLGR
jgi:tetratricopeptide (TPR) repeat protein